MIKRQSKFTLLEVMISFALISVMIVALVRMFSTTQNTCLITSEQQETARDARIAFDLMSRDLQCVYYGNDTSYVPFWHCMPESSWGKYKSEFIAFAASSPVKPNEECTSSLCEIKYQLYPYGTGKSDQELNGWLRRSITGNMTTSGRNAKWNIFNTPDSMMVSYNNPDDIFTANSNSSNSYQKLIPHVTLLRFTCYDKAGNIIPAQVPQNNKTREYNLGNYDSLDLQSRWLDKDKIPYASPPYSINIALSLLDRKSWNKWVSLLNGDSANEEPPVAKRFREKHQKTFSSTVLIGNRGQYT